jgi:hypothetical protein
MEDIDVLLDKYEPGNIKNKPDVVKQLAEIKESREKIAKEHNAKQTEYQKAIQKIKNVSNPQNQEDVIIEQSRLIQELTIENGKLKEKVTFLEGKIKELINNEIQKRLLEKKQGQTITETS